VYSSQQARNSTHYQHLTNLIDKLYFQQAALLLHMTNPATTKHLTWKLESQICRAALFVWFYVYPFWYNTEMWQTHTDRRTDTRQRHIPHLV